jgi:hypothetical protein
MEEMSQEEIEQYHYEYLEWCKSEEEKEYLEKLDYEAEKNQFMRIIELTNSLPA